MSECKVTRRKGLVKQDPIVVTDSEEDASPSSPQIVPRKTPQRLGFLSKSTSDITSNNPPSLSSAESIKTPQRPIAHSASTTSSTSTSSSAGIASIFDEGKDPNEDSSPESPPPEKPEGLFACDRFLK